MIQWNIFKNNMLNFFNENKNKSNISTMNIAMKFTDEYESAIINGGDMIYNNNAIIYNKLAMIKGFNDILNTLFNIKNSSMVSSIMGSILSSALIQFWTGAQLNLLYPPPGTISIVSNLINSPGIAVPYINIKNTEDNMEFIDTLVQYFSTHLKTITGTTIALIPASPTPIPTPFIWIGYI